MIVQIVGKEGTNTQRNVTSFFISGGLDGNQ